MSKNSNNVEAIYPLSPMQQGMLFHALYAPKSEAYFVQISYRFRGNLNTQALKQAWQHVLDRHSVLRTLFSWERSDKLYQVVRRKLQVPWQELDWRGIARDEQETRFQRFLADDRARGFNLSQAPLMRLALIRMQDAEFQLIVDFHHILLDGWSVALVLKEVFSLYDAFARGETLRLEPVRPYRDYIRWLQGQDLKAAESYWREALRGFTRPTPFRVERAHSSANASAQMEFHDQKLKLGAELSTSLRQLAKQQRVTLNTVVQGAWALVLSRYSGESEVVFGAVMSGRAAEIDGVEAMAGLFINTLPVRVRVKEGEEVGEWLRELQEQQVEVRRYEYSPLVQVQRWSDVPAELPLFESLYAFSNYPVQSDTDDSNSGLEVEMAHSVDRTTFPLDLAVSTRTDVILKLSYHRNRFDDETIGRMLGHLQTVLEALAENPKQRLSELTLLTAKERQQLLVEWNDTGVEYAEQQCLHRLFEVQAERTPERAAVVSGEQRLSYRELNERANRLADYLQRLGVRPDVLVGILMERSLEMVVAVLGVLKAGGAYVPLDPQYPQERLAYLLRDADAPVVLTQRHLVDVLSKSDARVVCLDAGETALEEASRENPASSVRSEHLAYVIYTSGSTGKPKGVAVAHRSVVNLSTALRQSLYRDEQEFPWRVSLNGSLAFDTSVKQLIQLLHGHTLYVVPQDIRLDGDALLSFIRKNRLDVLDCTPSQLKILLASGFLSAREAIPRRVLIGGEPIDEALWQTLAGVEGDSFYNLYGPTECTVDATIALVEGSQPTIGRAVANTEVYVLDGDMQPVPVGVPGELHVGGHGLSRGYLNRPDLTATKFIPNPFGARSGSRMYKTGDLVRYLADGRLEYLGRSDYQIKIRGFRVELGEIESILKEHPSVEEAVVLAREGEAGSLRLVAYLVASPDKAQPVGELRAFLAEQLPEYMIPSAFVMLDALPLSPNGKVDRQALPSPDATRPQVENDYVTPQTPAETLLAEIWREVLGLDTVGIHDNFFELGGDSILSIQIITRANRRGLRLSPRMLFEHPTISALAATAELANDKTATNNTAAEQGLVTGEVPLTPIQRQFFDCQLTDPHHFNQAMLLKLAPATDFALLEEVLQAILRQHDTLRLRFHLTPDGWQQRYAEPAPLSCTRLDLSHLDLNEQCRRIEQSSANAQASLNLSEGPLLRALYFHLGERQSARLLLVIHHLVVDGVSWRILLDDLQRGYQQLAQRQPVELGDKTASFKQWSEVLHEEAQSERRKAELSYWTNQAWQDVPPLPKDDESAPNTVAQARTLQWRLNREETGALLREVAEAYHTQITEVLLAALSIAYQRWSGAAQLIVSLEGHGREEVREGVDVTRTVGWFTSVYPVLLESSTGGDIGERVKEVKEQVRRVPERGIGYGMLKYLSKDEGVRLAMRRVREGEVSFNYLGQFDQVMRDGMFTPAEEWSGEGRSLKGERKYVLNVDSMVSGGELEVSWTYGEGMHRRERIEELGEAYMGALREIISHCLSPEAGGFTVSDFPLAKLNEEKLGKLSALLSSMGEEA